MTDNSPKLKVTTDKNIETHVYYDHLAWFHVNKAINPKMKKNNFSVECVWYFFDK